jgi:hypothetical protein
LQTAPIENGDFAAAISEQAIANRRLRYWVWHGHSSFAAGPFRLCKDD